MNARFGLLVLVYLSSRLLHHYHFRPFQTILGPFTCTLQELQNPRRGYYLVHSYFQLALRSSRSEIPVKSRRRRPKSQGRKVTGYSGMSIEYHNLEPPSMLRLFQGVFIAVPWVELERTADDHISSSFRSVHAAEARFKEVRHKFPPLGPMVIRATATSNHLS